MRHNAISETPFAILDVETTGFGPKHEIVEIAVVHWTPNLEPELVFDSLVRPRRRVGNRHVHGISNRDVRNAPALEALIDSLRDALADRMLVTFNATFDIGFLTASEPAVLPTPVPYLCAMRLHERVAGEKRSLEEAVVSRGAEAAISHRASEDAMAAARLVAADLDHLAAEGLNSWGDLDESTRGSSLISLAGEPLSKSAFDSGVLESMPHQYPREKAAVKTI